MMSGNGKGLLADRTKSFALRIVRMYVALPKSGAQRVLGQQAPKSGTSVGAQYREAMRARSKAEFSSKAQSALQEMEETAYWLELLAESGLVKPDKLASLRAEADEICAMLAASVKTARGSGTK